MLVALAAAPAARRQHKAVRLAEVGQQAFALRPFGENQRAHRQAQHQIFTFSAVALAALAGLAVAGLVKPLQAKVVKGKQAAVGPQVHGTAVAAIAAVRAAARHKFFTPEGQAAVAALARPNLYFRLIHKSHVIPRSAGARRPRLRMGRNRRQRGGARLQYACQNTKREEAAPEYGFFPQKFHASVTLLSGRFHMHARQHAAFADVLFKTHHTLHLGEEGEIPAHTHVIAGVHHGAQLTHKNIAGQHTLTAETLDAAALTGAVATVARRAACFFMSHDSLLNAEASKRLPHLPSCGLACLADSPGRQRQKRARAETPA